MDIIEKIERNNLCLGCGLCVSALAKPQSELQLQTDGFYHPHFGKLSEVEDKSLSRLCPAVHIDVHSESNNIWGDIKNIYEGWSCDEDIRWRAASGGAVTALAVYALKMGLVDAVLQVGVRDDHYLYNELKISRTAEDVINNAQSRYAPTPTLVNICRILDSTTDNFLFIGKPCDIVGIKNLISERPRYASRFVYFVSIFCAGIPSYNASVSAWQSFGKTAEPTSLRYRGEGWPGNFEAKWLDGTSSQMTYNDSWGKILGRHLPLRCKICPDGIGMQADIAVGDSWNTKDGYPDFTEDKGRCFIMERTANGNELIKGAVKAGYLTTQGLDANKISIAQPYQYERRKAVGWRILAIQLLTNWLLHFKGLNLFSHSVKYNWHKGLKNFIGTIKRHRKR